MYHDPRELLPRASTAGPEPSSTEPMRVDSIERLEVQLGDHRAHYLRAGRGSPVVLLHGGASDAFDWAETMVALSESYSLYAPDLIGYGLSDHKSDGSQTSPGQYSGVQQTEPLGNRARHGGLGHAQDPKTSTTLPQVLEGGRRRQGLAVPGEAVLPQGTYTDCLEPL
jgi:hypothetical protein